MFAILVFLIYLLTPLCHCVKKADLISTSSKLTSRIISIRPLFILYFHFIFASLGRWRSLILVTARNLLSTCSDWDLLVWAPMLNCTYLDCKWDSSFVRIQVAIWAIFNVFVVVVCFYFALFCYFFLFSIFK